MNIKTKIEKKISRYLKSFIRESLGTFGLEYKKDENPFLLENKMLRMDPNRIDLFDISRCNFHLDRYRFACKYTEDKVCVDCASGLEYGAYLLSRQGMAKKIFGVEIDPKAVRYAKDTYKADNIEYKVGSILSLPLDANSVDVFISFETIEHIKEEEKQLSEIKRVLKDGGLYICSTPNDWESDTINPFHVRKYNYYSLKKLLEENFSSHKIYIQNSGTIGRAENNNQPRQICPATEENHSFAECFIAVATK